jgi:hypothetical protein
MQKLLRLLAAPLLLAFAVGVLPVHAAVLKVGVRGPGCRDARFSNIQSAVNAAASGDRVFVCPGIYAEQVVITRRIQVVARDAIVRPANMVANTTSLATGNPIAAIFTVSGPAGVVIRGFDIDGGLNGLEDCNAPILTGVFFRNAGGRLVGNRVHDLRLGTEDAACENGIGILAQTGNGRLAHVAIRRNFVYDYQRSGIIVNESGTTASIAGNAVIGLGPTAGIVQNGIQVGFRARARITGNVVADNDVTGVPGCTYSGGNLLFESDGGFIGRNIFSGNTSGAIVAGDGNRIVANRLDGLDLLGTARGLEGIAVFGNGNAVMRNAVTNMSEAGIRIVGNANRAIRNAVTLTNGDALCEPATLDPECSEFLTDCGIGIWVASGTGNVVRGNTFGGNDEDVRDEGTETIVRHRPGP